MSPTMQETQAELQRLRSLHRALRTISAANHCLVHATDETGLLNDVCALAVDTAGYRMAWVGYVEPDEERSVRPVAWAGAESGYLANIKVSWGEGPLGQGPTGRCIRERRPVTARDIQHDPRFEPWRDEATLRGYQSSLAMPLVDADGAVLGALMIYALEPSAFDREETELLTELADDLAFGIGALRDRASRAHAEKRLAEAARYSRSLIETTLSPLVLIAPDGTIADVNKAMEEATGLRRADTHRQRVRPVLHRSRARAGGIPTCARGGPGPGLPAPAQGGVRLGPRGRIQRNGLARRRRHAARRPRGGARCDGTPEG